MERQKRRARGHSRRTAHHLVLPQRRVHRQGPLRAGFYFSRCVGVRQGESSSVTDTEVGCIIHMHWRVALGTVLGGDHYLVLTAKSTPLLDSTM